MFWGHFFWTPIFRKVVKYIAFGSVSVKVAAPMLGPDGVHKKTRLSPSSPKRGASITAQTHIFKPFFAFFTPPKGIKKTTPGYRGRENVRNTFCVRDPLKNGNWQLT